MAQKEKPIPEEIQREAEEEIRHRMPGDGEAEADEKFLETEAPYNDERRRYSPEYGSAPNALDELSINPDGRETYDEEDDLVRARGENQKGSSQGESGAKTLGIPEPPPFPDAPLPEDKI